MADTPTPENQPTNAPEDTTPPTPVVSARGEVLTRGRLIVVAVVLFAVAILAVVALLIGGRSDTKDAKSTQQQTANNAANTGAESSGIKISVIEEGKLVLPNGHADPTVVPTENGYRMYVNRQSGGPTGVLIYKSADGVTWQKEKDIILPGTSTSRAVVLPTGVRLYYPGAMPIKPSDPPASILSTSSTDGLNFTKDTGTVVAPRTSGHYLEGPTVFQLADKSWRMYFNENTVAAANQRDGEIWGASSKDGTTWTRDDKPTIQADDVEANAGGRPAPWKQVLHPFVVKNPKGGYIMFYNSHSEIFAATSKDGLEWKKLGAIGIHGADIDGYFQADGTMRVYYGDFSEQTGGLVYSAVLKIDGSN